MASKSASRWKRQEREIAAAVGGARQPNNGRSQADVLAPGWAIQVKTKQALPAWLWSAVEQARRDAHDGAAPAVVLSEVYQGAKAKRLVVLEFEVFTSLIGAAER